MYFINFSRNKRLKSRQCLTTNTSLTGGCIYTCTFIAGTIHSRYATSLHLQSTWNDPLGPRDRWSFKTAGNFVSWRTCQTVGAWSITSLPRQVCIWIFFFMTHFGTTPGFEPWAYGLGIFFFIRFCFIYCVTVHFNTDICGVMSYMACCKICLAMAWIEPTIFQIVPPRVKSRSTSLYRWTISLKEFPLSSSCPCQFVASTIFDYLYKFSLLNFICLWWTKVDQDLIPRLKMMFGESSNLELLKKLHYQN